nr:MAG TPA: hypothetical protein [Bacteriophage sp.]
MCLTIAPGKTCVVEAAIDGNPTTLPLTWDEIVYANNSNVFKSGSLEFQSNIENDIYNELGIVKENVLKYKEIKEILLHPDKNGLQKILKIKTLSDFDRVREIFQKLKFEGYSITLDVNNLVKKRTEELFLGKSTSSILVDDTKNESSDSKKVQELEKQLEGMKAMMETLLKSNNEIENLPIAEDMKNTQVKKAGRPKKID